MIAAIQDVPNLSVANLPPATDRSADVAALQRAAPQVPSAIVDLRSESPQPLTYNAAGRLDSQAQVPGTAGNTPEAISLAVAENIRTAIANLFAPPPAPLENDNLAPVAPNTLVGGLPALTVTTLFAELAANANAAPATPDVPDILGTGNASNTTTQSFAAPAPSAPTEFTTPEAAPALVPPPAEPNPIPVAPATAAPANDASPEAAPPDGNDDATATPVTAATSAAEEEAADPDASDTDPASRAAPVVASPAPEATEIRAVPLASADLGVTTEEVTSTATPPVQPPAPTATPEAPELPVVAAPVTPTVPDVARLTPDRDIAPVTAPIQQTALNAPIAAQNEIARNPFYPAMAASLYLSAMTDRFQQASSRELDNPLDSIQPAGAVRPIVATSFDEYSPSDDPRSGVPG